MSEVRESCLDTWVASSRNGDGHDVIECNRSWGGTVAVEIVSRRDDGIMTVSHIFLDREAVISLHEWLGRRLSSPVELVCPPDCPGCGMPMIPNPFLGDWECHECGWSLLRRIRWPTSEGVAPPLSSRCAPDASSTRHARGGWQGSTS